MATRKHTETAAVPHTEAHPLFQLNGKYCIAPETTAMQLRDDIACLLEGVSGIVNTIMDAANDPNGQVWASPRQVAGLTYAADYMLQMIESMNTAAMEIDGATVKA